MYEFSINCCVVFGENAIEQLPGLLKSKIKVTPIKRILIVTSEIMEWNNVMIENIDRILSDDGFQTIVFDGVKPNPTLENIEAGKKIYNDENCDSVLALGGGSPIDAAKIIASENHARALVTVPTTAGTGSEVSAWSVITDSSARKKISLHTREPDIALLDPCLTLTMPPALTFYTAVDAFSHAMESYISRSANCFSDSLSYRSILLTSKNLGLAVSDGNNLDARSGLLEASLLSGIAMMSAGLGVGHALGNTIGGIYHDSVHGWILAQLVENVWRVNTEGNPPKVREIDSSVHQIFSQIDDLSRDLNLTKDCFEKQHLGLIVENSMNNVNIKSNPVDITAEKMATLLCSSFDFQ